jgi:CBS domain containing-hemolysin-like protein
MSPLAVALLALLLAMAASHTFSGAETGAYSLNRARHRLRVADGLRRALLVDVLTRDMAMYVAVILIGNNIANSAISITGTLVCEQLQLPHPELWSTALLVPLVFVSCELVPKELFRRHADGLTYQVAPFIAVCAWLFAPATWALRALHRLLAALGVETEDSGGRLQAQERLRTAIAASREEGALTAYQATLAANVFALHARTVRQVMVPLPKADGLEAGTGLEEARERVRLAGRTRLPVHRDRPENVVGVLTSWDLLFEERPGLTVRNYIEPAFSLPPEEKVSTALLRMRQARAKLAIVREGERALGLVTMKDLVEEITGELRDL